MKPIRTVWAAAVLAALAITAAKGAEIVGGDVFETGVSAVIDGAPARDAFAAGFSATVDAFACLLVGHDDVAVYDGSMAEWVRDESLPMETGR